MVYDPEPAAAGAAGPKPPLAKLGTPLGGRAELAGAGGGARAAAAAAFVGSMAEDASSWVIRRCGGSCDVLSVRNALDIWESINV